MNMDSIIKSIESATTRNEVNELLLGLKKKELIVIAKYFNIYIKSFEKMDMIKMKIVENTIGLKLRIEAIKNTNLKN